MDAARAMDVHGNKAAKAAIAAIKIVAPRMAKAVIDRSMQAHGAKGLSQDLPLAHLWASARVLQLADGPDEVHIASLGRMCIDDQVPGYKEAKKAAAAAARAKKSSS